LATATLPANTPLAFTTFVTSFDGTKISVNYFPALGATAGTESPTILNGPGLGTAGNTDPNAPYTVSGLVPGLPTLRDGYNVVTWDPRGEFASGGTLQLDSPAYEGQDVSSIITWTTGLDTTKMDTVQPATGGPDPLIGMVGGSYGGGIQLVAAGIDPRVDAIVPGIAWNNLTDSLYPNDTFKTSYSSLLLLSLVTIGAKINNQIYAGIATGDLLGKLTQSQQALLNSSGPDFLLPSTTTPTLFIQGTVDVLFPLQQSLANASQLNPAAPVKMIWFCGGHGACLDLTPTQQAAQSEFLSDETMAWLDFYVKDEHPITDPVPGPKFQWIDNLGVTHSSTMLPDDPAFATYVGNPVGEGGFLPIVPVVGGSGPQTAIPIPYSLGLGAPAKNAVNTPIATTAGDEIVGSPTVSFDYSGVGTTDHVYVQIVDKSTGLVVGNIVTPVDVTLDGKQHTATVNMEDIAYTATPTTDLELQVVSSATPFLSLTSFGGMQISNVQIAMPIVN
jgi:ABC-2 type transport system ATP-binding protein